MFNVAPRKTRSQSSQNYQSEYPMSTHPLESDFGVFNPVSPALEPQDSGAPIPTRRDSVPHSPTQMPPRSDQTPPVISETYYTPGFLKTQIGQKVRVEFLIGTNAPMVDRTGTLVGVGASYILLNIENTDDLQLCDLYSIKFVTVYR